MDTLNHRIDALKRPRLLVRAARLGLAHYRRERDLTRLLGAAIPTSVNSLVEVLLGREAGMEEARSGGEAHYSAPMHLDVLIALIAEAQQLRAVSVEVSPPPRLPYAD
jgi:hypothetical protein